MIRKIICIMLLITAAACTSPQQVSEHVLLDLEARYGRKFVIHSVNMNHDEGNWGGANLVVYPADDESLTFHVNYNYSDMKLTWEDYKGALWNREMKYLAASVFGVQPEDVTAVITSNNSIAFDSMSLPWHEKFADAVKDIKHPRLSIKIKLRSDNFLKSAQFVASGADKFITAGFEKVTVSADLCAASGACESIKFKVTAKHRSPAGPDLAELFKSAEAVSMKKAGLLYQSAADAYARGDYNRALQVYRQVVNEYDNPYRYDPYVVLESNYVVESAFNAAEILRVKGDTDSASFYYRLVVERLEFHEVKAELYDMDKAARRRLSGENPD